MRSSPAAGASDPGLQRQVNEDRFHVDSAAASSSWSTAWVGRRPAARRPTWPSPRFAHGWNANRTAGRSHSRSDHRREQRDSPAGRAPARVAGDGLCADGRGRRRRSRGDRPRRRHAPVQTPGRASTRSRPTTRRSASARTPGEISELEAMRHPRRNEVYRDVGSEPTNRPIGTSSISRTSIFAPTRRCSCAAMD